MPSNLRQQEPPLWWGAALQGSTELVVGLLSTSTGSVDIDRPYKGLTAVMGASRKNHHRVVEVLLQNGAGVDHRNDDGFTALSLAANNGHYRVARVLLQNGATVFSGSNSGFTALMLSAQNGHLVVAAMLVRAGAELEARNVVGLTALHLAAMHGQFAVVKLLAEVGANPDTHTPSGEGPLYSAAFRGHADIVKLLLGLGVNPARAVANVLGEMGSPLRAAAQDGHKETVRELLQLGIEACGGAKVAKNAFVMSAIDQHFDVMVMLRDAGAADSDGRALFTASDEGSEAVVKFLLQQEWATFGGMYVNNRNSLGFTALFLSVGAASSRIARMLLDAGADDAKPSPLDCRGAHFVTPLGYTVATLAIKMLKGKSTTEDQLHRLEAIRRLLLRVDAVRAMSWVWPRKAHAVGQAKGKRAAVNVSTPLGGLIVWRGYGARPSLLASIFR